LKINNLQMGKFRIISEFLYLIISVVLTLDYIFGDNSDERKNFILIFALLSFGMFLFRRHYRIKFKNRAK